jgi:hypothetical protein
VRTEAHLETGAVEGVLVRFELDAKARRALLARARPGRGATKLRAELDALWKDFGLCGAALLFQGILRLPPQLEIGGLRAAAPTRRLAATSRLLAANVLGRTRGHLLLPGMPLDLRDGFLSRAVWSDDPRLVGAALRSGVEVID